MRRVSFMVWAFVLMIGTTVGAAASYAPGQARPQQGEPQAPRTDRAKQEPGKAAMVNINTASTSQLEELPGIGARTAQAIVDHRQKNGGFKKIEELMNVKGIGEKSFLKLKPLISVGAEKPDRAGA